MSSKNTCNHNLSIKKRLIILITTLIFLTLLTTYSVSAQVSANTAFTTVECFDISDFSVEDLTTTCEEGIAEVEISLGQPSDCPAGATILNYSGSTECGDEFSLDVEINVLVTPMNIALTVPDITLSCRDDVNPQPSDVSVLTSCGEAGVVIEEVIGEAAVDICSQHVRSFRYTVSDNCSTEEVIRDFTIIPDPVSVDVGPRFNNIVDCVEDLANIQDDITISLPCGAEVLNINFNAPDLTREDGNCNSEDYDFSWEVETTCGIFQANKSFSISNDEAELTIPDDITISCTEHPLSDEVLLEGVSIVAPCPSYPEIEPFQFFRPSEELPATFTSPETYTYSYSVTDPCTGSDEQVVRRVTVLPEGPTITFNDEVIIINSVDLLFNSEILLEGVDIVPACCEINGIRTFFTNDSTDFNPPPNVPLEFSVEVRDECNNKVEETTTLIFIPPVSLTAEEVTVQCFNLDDFSEANLTTTCAEGFADVEVSMASLDAATTGRPFGCCVGTVFVSYEGSTVCGDEFSLLQEVDITNPGLAVMIPEDITISCLDFTPPTADDVTANSPCGGEVNVLVIEVFDIQSLCNDRTRRFRYTVSDDCETIVLTQNIRVTQVPLTLDVGPTDVTVECIDEISVSEDDIDIQLPCDAVIEDITFTEPNLSDPLASCDDEIHEFSWQVLTTCGPASITKRFHVINEGISEVDDVTISCVDYPLGLDEFLDLVFETSCGIEISNVSDFVEINGPLEEICTETEVSYLVAASDECENFIEVTTTITVLPELPTITFDEEETTVTCREQLGDEEFLLQGVNIDSPCSSVDPNGIQINTFQTDPGEDDSCNGITFSVGYEVFDECGNSAEASKTFIVNNPDFSIEVAPDVTVECLEAISVSPFDVTVNDICGSPRIGVREEEVIEGNGCPGEIITVNYDIEFTCGTETTVSRNFTIGEQSLEPIVFDEEVIDGAVLNFSCAEESEIDERLNASTVLFEEFFCNVSIGEPRAKVCLEADFEKIELPSDNCETDGFLRRFQFNWTLTDDCGRTGSVTVFANVVDNQAPVFSGLPSDITIGCEEEVPPAPIVTVEDDCTTVEFDFSEEMGFVVNGAFNQKVITRTWSSTDECGNNTTEVRTITIVDEEAPELSFVNEEGLAVENGETIIVECDEDFDWIFDLSKEAITAIDNCGCLHPEFQLTILDDDEANTRQLKQQFIPKWTVSDEFGNVTEFTFTLQTFDTKPPVFGGTDTMFICGQETEGLGFGVDACGQGFSYFMDFPIEGYPEEVFTRRYYMFDEVKNRDKYDQLAFDFSESPDLIVLREDIDLTAEPLGCEDNQSNITPFSASDVISLFDPYLSLDISFEEIIYPKAEDDELLQVDLRWIATTPCGYSDTITEMVYILDETPPVFEAFEGDVTVDCIESAPQLIALDACGIMSFEYSDLKLEQGCGYTGEINRTYLAIDASGNSASATQKITIIDTLAPLFYEESQICKRDAEASVYAIDPCSNETILATIINDSLVYECAEYSVYERTLSASDDCGNTTLFTQEVYEDGFSLQYVIADATLENLIAMSHYDIDHDDVSTRQAIFSFDYENVYATDSCGNVYEASYERNIIEYGRCENGYEYSIEMIWFFAEACRVNYSYTVQFNLLQKPVSVEPLVDMQCDQTMPAVKIQGLPSNTYYETFINDNRDEHGNGSVLREIYIPDYCGDEINLEQTITYESAFTAKIIGEMQPSCNGGELPYEVEVEGGTAPFEVEWEAAQICEIIPSESSLQAAVLFSEPETALTATITDATGCTVVCEAVVSCAVRERSLGNEEEFITSSDLQLQAYPNPFLDEVRIETGARLNTSFTYTLYDHLGQLQSSSKGLFIEDSSIKLNLSGMPSGLYYISVENEGQQETLKIVKI